MKRRGSRLLTLALLAAGAALMLFPLWWMLVVSLETPSNAGAATVEVGAISAFPADPQWSNWTEAMRAVGTVEWQGFLDALANSILVTFLTVTATVFSCSLVGYALARVRFRGRGLLFAVMLGTMMLPPQVTMIPMFLVFRELGWVDTILPLVVPAFFGNAFFIFMFRQFMAQVPEALVEVPVGTHLVPPRDDVLATLSELVNGPPGCEEGCFDIQLV